MDRINFNGQNSVATSAVNVVVNDIRNNGGNYKWQIEKINVIKEFFNEDFFEDELGQYIEVDIMVNGREVFPRVCFDGEYYVPEASAFQSSKKSVSDMVASMTEMIKKIAVECGFIQSDFYPLSFVNLTPSVFGTMVENVFGTMGEQEQVVEQENEQENEDIDYLVTIFNEKMDEDISKDFESTLQTIAEYGDPSGENEYVCGGFNYERDYEHEWVEFYNEHGNGGINHAYEIFRNAPSFTYVDFFNEDDAWELVYELGDTYGVEVEDNSFEECNVWVKNPYYKAPKDNAPCLDIDIAVDRVVNTIEKYLGSYNPSDLDKFGDCVITIYWDEFNEQDMKMLIEDNIFAMSVRDTLYERGVIKNLSGFLVYDDGVYVTVDYDKTFDKSNVLNTLRREYNWPWSDLDEYEMPINTLADRCGGYHVNAPIYVMYNKESDSYYVNGLGEDNDYAINEKLTSRTTYMELYDMITELLENENVADTIENALDEAMESDDEYNDDIICQIGKWFVKYTSPCDKFPSGCVCVVDAKGVNMGGTWCSVADFDTAVEYLVGMIEICNKEFNKVA